MKIRVTEQDIQQAVRNGIDNLVTRALQRVAGENWYAFDNNMAYELTPPYRSVFLPEAVLHSLWAWQSSGVMRSFEFDLALPLSEGGGESLESAGHAARYSGSAA